MDIRLVDLATRPGFWNAVHELSHNFGCSHEYLPGETGSANGFRRSPFGGLLPPSLPPYFRTIMAYPCFSQTLSGEWLDSCPLTDRVHFSNPWVTHTDPHLSGLATGIIGIADCASLVARNSRNIAAFRRKVVDIPQWRPPFCGDGICNGDEQCPRREVPRSRRCEDCARGTWNGAPYCCSASGCVTGISGLGPCPSRNPSQASCPS